MRLRGLLCCRWRRAWPWPGELCHRDRISRWDCRDGGEVAEWDIYKRLGAYRHKRQLPAASDWRRCRSIRPSSLLARTFGRCVVGEKLIYDAPRLTGGSGGPVYCIPTLK